MTQQALQACVAGAAAGAAGELVTWQHAAAGVAAEEQQQGAAGGGKRRGGGAGSGEGWVEIQHKFPVKYVTWHARGDYFSSVAPTGNTQVGVWACSMAALSVASAGGVSSGRGGAGQGGAAGSAGQYNAWQLCSALKKCSSVDSGDWTGPSPCAHAPCQPRYAVLCCAVQAVLVHQLSKGASQNPFRKNRGRVVRVLFHPSKPFFFVATQQHVSGGGWVGGWVL